MKVGEASRQYQAALEYERAMRTDVGGLLSFEPELAQVHADTIRAHAQLLDVMYLSRKG